ncbi:hypothetical protein PLICRDRAFT_353374 [Plicaturopsis crispa FD-325 SS-3]|uniref:Uncharacterized protein n=1 Tax=Plicaturopsis crispa FD-325 SS-3 TaxID=944288 RepID=A0A0C9SRD8_PLICR|nr:hypothetical protein PLICRDRAFT_353374 [Plicaturopsis crispa FD-325 SS-3]
MDFTVDTQDMTVGMNIDNTGPVNSLEHPFYPQSSVSLYPSSETHAYTTPFVVEYAAGAAPLGMHTHAVDASFAEAFSRWPVPVPAPAVNMITEEDDDHVDWVDVDGNGGGVDVDFEYTQLPIIDDDGNSEYEDDDDDTDVDGDKYIKDDRNRGKRYWDYAPRIMRRIKLVHAKTRAFIMLYMSRPESVLARNGKALFYASPGMVSALGDSNAFSAGVHRAVKRHVKNSTLSATQALALNAQVATATRAKKEADARLAEEIAHRKALEARLVQFQLDYTAPV